MVEVGQAEVIIGIIAPLITAAVKQRYWSSGAATAVCIIVIAILGAGAYVGGTDVNVIAAWAMAIVTYYGAWKPTGIAPMIEEATYLDDAATLD